MKSAVFVVTNTNAARHSGLVAVRFCPLPLAERSEVMRFLLVHVPALVCFTVNHHLSYTSCISYTISYPKYFTSQMSGISPQPNSLKSGMDTYNIYIYMHTYIQIHLYICKIYVFI